ncbi:MAG: cyclic nucleotide-binding domain-containing protein [Pseudomonadota bacterium]
MGGLDVLVNAANVVYLFSYSVRDIFWLRILTVVAASLLIPYFYLQSAPLWAPIGWNTFFIGINLYWIALLLAERRPVPFTDEERRLYTMALQNLSERDAYKLLQMAERRAIPKGTELIPQGGTVDMLSLIVEGDVTVEENSKRVDRLGDGSFLGSIAFLSQGRDFASPVTVRTSAPTTVLTWKFSELNSLFSRNSALQIAMEASLGLEISRWLETSRQTLMRT